MSNDGTAASITTNYMFVAASTLIFYDHLITIDQEMSWFWSGKWSISRFLFFSVKTFYIFVLLVSLMESVYRYAIYLRSILFYYGNVGFSLRKVIIRCTGVGHIDTSHKSRQLEIILTPVDLSAALAMRVWYLFTRSRVMQNAVIAFAFICMTLTVVFAAETPDTRQQGILPACNYAVNQQTAWRMYFPPVTLHIALYGLTIYKMLTTTRIGEIRGLKGMIIDEGAHLYLLGTGLSMIVPDGLDSTMTTI
ncbi:hypothetical protein BDR07DRAFT_1378179 [Suillus spraguei]|nr:hypothetical protein BDR07DRAFT_1378179 [Suillus spraguei]